MSTEDIAKALLGDSNPDEDHALKDLIIDEIEAIQGYDRMIAHTTNERTLEVLKEIRADEWNHIGRLCDLLRPCISSADRDMFLRGLNQED